MAKLTRRLILGGILGTGAAAAVAGKTPAPTKLPVTSARSGDVLRGPTGDPGLRWVSDWSPSAGYYAGDIVHHGGKVYTATCALHCLGDAPGGSRPSPWAEVS